MDIWYNDYVPESRPRDLDEVLDEFIDKLADLVELAEDCLDEYRYFGCKREFDVISDIYDGLLDAKDVAELERGK